MLQVVFMGTAGLACSSLEAIARSPGFTVPAVVTQPDRPKGRDLKLTASPVKSAALRLNLPVLQPLRARGEDFVQELEALRPDLIVVAAYGQILPGAILDLPRFGCINVHTSLLPKYRGAAPIQWALLNDEPETGVTIMQMDAGLDTGAILAQRSTPITGADTAETLHDRLAGMGADLLMDTIPGFVSGDILPRPQPEPATYARKITKEDGRIPWTDPARAVWNRIRALNPWPGTSTFQETSEKPRRLNLREAAVEPEAGGVPGTVLQAGKDGIVVACGEKALRILKLQREGGRVLAAVEFLAGSDIQPGTRFS